MKNVIFQLLALFYFFPLPAQDQFTNNGNFTILAGTRFAVFGDFENNGTFSDSGLESTFAGITAQTIKGTSITTFKNLTIKNTSTAGITLAQSLNTSGTLTLTAGKLNTNSTYILKMLNGSSTLVGTAASISYVNGPMIYQKSTAGLSVLNFPIGKGTECRPVSLSVNHTGTTLYNYNSESFNGDAKALGYTLPPTISKVSRVHYWIINRTDNSATAQPTANLNCNQTIQIFFDSSDFVLDGNTLRICKNNDTAATKWFDIGGTGGPAYNAGAHLSGSITSTSAPSAFNSFSTFTLANVNGGINPLPVQLIDFTSECESNNIVLKWSTASESNTDYFTIQRITDNNNWENVGILKAAGTSNTLLNYIYNEKLLFIENSYFRIKLTNLNGQFEFSNILQSTNCNTIIDALTIYPNHSKGLLYLSYNGDKEKINSIAIYNALGVKIYESSNYQPVIDLTNQLTGMYFIYFKNEAIDHSIKVVIEK